MTHPKEFAEGLSIGIIMDGTAATLCRDNKLPILVFDLADPDNIARAVQGENVGTLVYEG